MNRVVVTGMSGVSSMGNDWNTIWSNLKAEKNFVKTMPEWDRFEGLNTRLASPIPDFCVPPEYPRKNIRSMGRVARLATVATNAALADAGLLGHPSLSNGNTGVAYGSSAGSTKPMNAFGQMLSKGD
ncbi:MAG: beta-ketoacyl-ACP synthase, partial [Gammaproteobacteria bacterium]|nr:beta-ketoacyl-ACP synthase [Gammaproteobacteria bacterium]